ncbi:hypothetical protein K488DRAFT_88226 [Vararia minispora EC-137]|uniref:Uncharacterized protein n=1 Tax=Vararia minispora EC-137 TaxID=1314806 RepID=A0ACB8QDU1_9AGAM|nr:hypothetical protein K488DRAFT_88226 [Vararia minispora EC-137]
MQYEQVVATRDAYKRALQMATDKERRMQDEVDMLLDLAAMTSPHEFGLAEAQSPYADYPPPTQEGYLHPAADPYMGHPYTLPAPAPPYGGHGHHHHHHHHHHHYQQREQPYVNGRGGHGHDARGHAHGHSHGNGVVLTNGNGHRHAHGHGYEHGHRDGQGHGHGHGPVEDWQSSLVLAACARLTRRGRAKRVVRERAD